MLGARELVWLAQGFYCVFWGLLLAAVVGTQMLLTRWLPLVVDAGLGAGALIVLAGSWRLAQVQLPARPGGDVWRRRAHRLRVAAGLFLYFCVPFYLWRRVPDSAYLLVNTGLFVVAAVAYVILFNQAVAGLGGALGQPSLAAEARLFNWGNFGWLALVAGFMGLIVFLAQWRNLPLSTVSAALLEKMSLPVALVLLLPFSLTLALAWGAKDIVLERLMAPTAPPQPPA